MGEISRKLKLTGARERYESIHDHDKLSHVLAPKAPIKFDPKQQSKAEEEFVVLPTQQEVRV
jgi:hypothetical protein